MLFLDCNTNLDYQNVDPVEHTSKVDIARKRFPWLRSMAQPENIKPFPCRQEYHEWNKQGVMSNDNKSTICIGPNSATTKRHVIGHSNPSHAVYGRGYLSSNKLFNMQRGIPSFPTSHSMSSARSFGRSTTARAT